jgi:hypothetical protein
MRKYMDNKISLRVLSFLLFVFALGEIVRIEVALYELTDLIDGESGPSEAELLHFLFFFVLCGEGYF